jgi:uncharacterized protein YfeS
MLDRSKKWHTTEVSELKAQLNQQKGKSKDELKAELKVKDNEKTEIHHQVKIYKKEQKINEAEIVKLQVALNKEMALLSSSIMIYATACCNVDTLAEVIKKLKSELKMLKKKSQDDQSAKFSYNEKMLVM